MEVDWVRVYQRNDNCTPDPNSTECNLIQNPDFTAGQSPWQTYISTSASASLSTNAGYADFTITNGSTDKYKVQLYQTGFELEQGKTYEISFNARADANKAIYVQFADQNDPPTQYHYQDFNVGTSWATQSFTFTMSNTTDSNARMSFGVGSNAIDVAIDDVVLKEQACVEPVLSDCNEVENADFGTGLQLWETDIHASANASLNTNSGYADFTIANGSDSRSKVKLFQTGLNLAQGKTYSISFKAKADANKAIYVKLSDENESITQYDWEDFTVGTNWNTYSYNYTMSFASDNAARISFGVGSNAIDIAFDDVVVEETDCNSSPPPPPNTCNSNARLANPAKVAVQGAFAKFAQASFTNNFIRAEKAYIKHQREIHHILSSKEKKYAKVVADFDAIKGIAMGLLYNSFTKFNREETISSTDIQHLNEFLVSLSKATKSQSLKDEIKNIQKYRHVMNGKEVKHALVDFDNATEEDAKDIFEINDKMEEDFTAQISNSIAQDAYLNYQSNIKGVVNISLYDLEGRKLNPSLEQTIDEGFYQYTLSKQNLSKGIYYVQVQFKAAEGKLKNTLLKLLITQ